MLTIPLHIFLNVIQIGFQFYININFKKMSNNTHTGDLFFQTVGAHVLSGFFAWMAILITGHQVKNAIKMN